MGPPPLINTKGVGGPVNVVGSGYIAWTFRTTNNQFRTVILPAVYIPTAPTRLLATTPFCRKYNEEIHQKSDGTMVTSGSSDEHPIPANINPHNDLPQAWAYRPSKPTNDKTIDEDDVTIATSNTRAQTKPLTSNSTSKHSIMQAAISEVSCHNINLNEGDKEWLKWHQRLGHRAFATIKYLMGIGAFAKSQRTRALHTQCSKRVECPKCAACCYAKAKRRPVEKPRTHSRVTDNYKSLRDNTLLPGQEVSVDHLVLSVPGRTYEGYGKGHNTTMFKGSAIFVDNATGYTYVHHQKSLNTHDTLRGKEAFEADCRDLGVIIQKYRRDNAAVFHSHEYKRHLEKFDQTQKFAGVGQHHANGIVEKTIQDVQSTARTMLIHLAIHWGDQADLALWPMAIDHAVFPS